MFGLVKLSPARLFAYGVLAYAGQHFLRRGYRRANEMQLAKKQHRSTNDLIDRASEDSFPASDSPAYRSSIVGPQ